MRPTCKPGLVTEGELAMTTTSQVYVRREGKLGSILRALLYSILALAERSVWLPSARAWRRGNSRVFMASLDTDDVSGLQGW